MAWAKCPLAVANTLSRRGTIKIGWSRARITVLPVRPLQCYRCLEGGHVRENCPNDGDRSRRCFRCGKGDHIAQDCTAPLSCPVCTDLGLPSSHRAGSGACAPSRKRSTGNRFKTTSINNRTRVIPPSSHPDQGGTMTEEAMDVERGTLSSAEIPTTTTSHTQTICTEFLDSSTSSLECGEAVGKAQLNMTQGSSITQVVTAEQPLPQRKRHRSKPQITSEIKIREATLETVLPNVDNTTQEMALMAVSPVTQETTQSPPLEYSTDGTMDTQWELGRKGG